MKISKTENMAFLALHRSEIYIIFLFFRAFLHSRVGELRFWDFFAEKYGDIKLCMNEAVKRKWKNDTMKKRTVLSSPFFYVLVVSGSLLLFLKIRMLYIIY